MKMNITTMPAGKIETADSVANPVKTQEAAIKKNDAKKVIMKNVKIENAVKAEEKMEKAQMAADNKSAKKVIKKTVIVKKTAAKKVEPKKAKKKLVAKGLGAKQIEHILAGMTNQQVLEAILKEFKEVDTSIACVAWYRSKLRAGEFDAPKNVLTNKEAKKKQEAKKS